MQLKCSIYLFSNHALKAMVERNISTDDVLQVINDGEIIITYADDKPYPSFLFLKFVNNTPLHIVMAHNADDDTCIVITCNHPDKNLWDTDFKNKMK